MAADSPARPAAAADLLEERIPAAQVSVNRSMSLDVAAQLVPRRAPCVTEVHAADIRLEDRAAFGIGFYQPVAFFQDLARADA